MARTLVVCVLALLLSACAGFRGAPKPLVNGEQRNQEVEKLKTRFSADQVLAYLDAPPGETRRAARNKIVQARMLAIDLRYAEYLDALQQELRGGAFGLDFISIALTGTATLLNPGTTTTILAGVDTAFKGARQAYSKEVLIERTLTALVTQMTADRNRLAAQIITGLGQSDAHYPLPLALAQVEDYYRAGTIVGALQGVNESAAKEAKASADDLENAIIQFRPDKTRDDLAELLCADADCTSFKNDQLEKVSRCMVALNMPSGSRPGSAGFVDFMFKPKNASDRIRVAQCMKR